MTETSSAEYHSTLNSSARLLQQNRPGEALAALEPYMNRLPGDADLAINVGGAYILQRKWDKAASLLREAATATPDNVMLWTNLAAAELGRLEVAGPRQQDRAIDAYQRALSIDPRAHNVHYSLGLIYKERGELMRAATFFQRALELNPVDKDAKYWLERIDLILRETRRAAAEEDEVPGGGATSETAIDETTVDDAGSVP